MAASLGTLQTAGVSLPGCRTDLRANDAADCALSRGWETAQAATDGERGRARVRGTPRCPCPGRSALGWLVWLSLPARYLHFIAPSLCALLVLVAMSTRLPRSRARAAAPPPKAPRRPELEGLGACRRYFPATNDAFELSQRDVARVTDRDTSRRLGDNTSHTPVTGTPGTTMKCTQD